MKLSKKRRGVQLLEEALLISVVLLLLTLVFGGVQGLLARMAELTSTLWDTIVKIIEELFGFLWKW